MIKKEKKRKNEPRSASIITSLALRNIKARNIDEDIVPVTQVAADLQEVRIVMIDVIDGERKES